MEREAMASLGYGRRDPVPAREQARRYVAATVRRGWRPGFVLYAQGRSGSTVLGTLLGCHPEVVFADEVLYAPVRWPARWLAGQAARHPGRLTGVHVKPYQLQVQQGIEDQQAWLRERVADGWTLLTLERHDVLRQTLSTAVASVTGTYHVSADGDGGTAPPAPPEVDPGLVVQGIRIRLDNLAADREVVAGLPHLALVYEQDLLDAAAHQATADRVLTHLGLASVPVAAPLRRTSSHPATDIANWDEVRAAVEAAGLADHLPDA